MLNIRYIPDFKAGQPFLVITSNRNGFAKAATFFASQAGCFLDNTAISESNDIRKLNDQMLYLTANECSQIAKLFENVAASDQPCHEYFHSAALVNAEILISCGEYAF